MSNQSELAQLAGVFAGSALSNRNLIINGAMQVAQRGTSFTGVQTGAYQIDRWKSLFSGVSTTGIATVTQSADAPSGFSHSYKMEVTTADTSLDPWAEYVVQQRIEGQNLAALKKGTADAEPVTVSFWVKSSTTGTYILEILDNQNSIRHINQSYTINTANTWEHKTLTFAGDTSGTLTYNNTVSLELNWCLAGGSNFTGGTLQTSWGSLVQSNRKVGQLNLYATSGNYWQITGVQLEVGDTSTPFEHRSYGDELARCQRYYYKSVGGGLYTQHGGAGLCFGIGAGVPVRFPVDMRATPSFSSSGSLQLSNATSGFSVTSVSLAGTQSSNQAAVLNVYASGLSTNSPYRLENAIFATSNLSFDAEL